MKIKTTLLKLVTAGIDAFVLLFSFMLMIGLTSSVRDHSIFFLQITTSIALYATCLVILVISYYLFRIFHLIDNHTFFTQQALHFVKTVRYLFITASVTLAGILPFVYYSAKHSDSPGVMFIAFAFVLVPIAIAAFISVMEKILINSIKFKQENELTI